VTATAPDGLASSLTDHLVSARLAGSVATPVRSCVENCRRLVAGDPDTTFGLSDWVSADYDEAVRALEACGVDLSGNAHDPDAGAYVDPSAALAAIGRHRAELARMARTRARVILATGHAFALLPHYTALARALANAGCTLLRPFDSQRDRFLTPDGQGASIRYLDGVGTLAYHGALHHTHRADYMEAMLDEEGAGRGVDAVIGDHGFAGAAVEAGIPTLSIADVNDPGLPLAQARGRTDGVLVIDDGVNPSLYAPMTTAMLDW
jgi:hypothetical protein